MKYLHAKSHHVTDSFDYITWQEVVKLIEEPPKLGNVKPTTAKLKSAVIAANDAPNKTKDTVLLHNNFTMLRADLDKTKLDISSLKNTLNNMGFDSHIIYTTSNHLQGDNGNRFRIFIELAYSIDFELWSTLTTYFSYVLSADDCASRPQQIMYLPCRFKGDNYNFSIASGKAYSPDGSKFLDDAIEFKRQQQVELEAKQQLNKGQFKPQFTQQLIGKQVSIVDAVNNYFDWDSILNQYGYIKQGKAWLPPEAKSNRAGVYLLTGNDGKERYYSHHENDPCASNRPIDKFDFITIRDYKNDSKVAVKELAKLYFKNIDEHNKNEWRTHLVNEQFNKLKGVKHG
ncbi:hypothetical protein [Colwellia sp. C1TZA3]|uniref:hypothetical protein n=1 Tax=Colwellia sp. C1TZA3 TaxID=2508879 RepID=UPI0011B9CB39|nr:hypothetical protein [Colwellia sp. C1TZA3]TWX73153.1 hypothetical protein ESZ39_05115 [Colwellia sp. C1TZA3]